LDQQEYIYIRDLEQLTEAKLLSWGMTGPAVLEELRAALQNYLAGRRVKSVQQCVEIQPRNKTIGECNDL
jgi:hypothetical protein